MAKNTAQSFLLLSIFKLVGCESPPPIDPVTFIQAELTVNIDGESILLEKGENRSPAAPGSASMNITTIHSPFVEADLDGDNDPDAIVVLTRSTGGTGTFYYVCAIPDYENNRLSTDAIFIGDRVSIESITVKANTVSLKYIDRDLNTSFAQEPTVEKIRRFRMEAGQLVQLSDSID
jgi:hypothetical protein